MSPSGSADSKVRVITGHKRPFSSVYRTPVTQPDGRQSVFYKARGDCLAASPGGGALIDSYRAARPSTTAVMPSRVPTRTGLESRIKWGEIIKSSTGIGIIEDIATDDTTGKGIHSISTRAEPRAEVSKYLIKPVMVWKESIEPFEFERRLRIGFSGTGPPLGGPTTC
ncbi:hypothetical protein EVAR_41356_1 [Eumeta japonica]|uniref:Uncharacterized protein n=1 Tax=Eumeta variegata TaxID=151549 RepID=A0A4C1XME1_EUMVA|nr:hypothetical protein EVAR_41356_1 [Eumeta japonica]